MNDFKAQDLLLLTFDAAQTMEEADAILWAASEKLARQNPELLLKMMVRYAFDWPDGEWRQATLKDDCGWSDESIDSFVVQLTQIMGNHGLTIASKP